MPAQALEIDPVTTKPSRLHAFAYRSALTAYRVAAIVLLYAVLLGVLAYAFVMGFYAINTTWAAPIILSASDEKSLDFTEKLVTSRQALEDLHVDQTRMQTTLAEMRSHRAALVALDPMLQNAIAREQQYNRSAVPQLRQLDTEKQQDNTQTAAIVARNAALAAEIHKDLAAGLITKGDAEMQLEGLNQTRGQLTDSRISETMLKDDILDKNTASTRSLDVLEKQAELRSEIAQLDVTMAVSEKELQEDNRQVDMLRQAIATAKQSPYYLNATGSSRLDFAFVPYDNQAAAKVGAPIYDCYLDMIFCRKVGVVKQVFPEEMYITHPIFKTQVRGFTVQMDLSYPRAATSKTLFLGGKPLLF